MTKKALIIGVNDYAPIGVGGPDLKGCVNDALDMANTLVICGFGVRNIRILTNQRATKANILRGMSWLFKNSKAGDSLVLYYSGHGTRITNFGGDYEVDGLDEAICPHDFALGNFITDDEFRIFFNANLKPKVNLEVIFDCCHSGTGTRNLALGLDQLNQGLKVRMIEPDAETMFYSSYERELGSGEIGSRALVPVANINHTLWAACRDQQLSYESIISGNSRGHFTYEFCKVLRATNGNIVRSRLDSLVQRALSRYGNGQVNQTESLPAEFSQMIFG
ncbi:MAG: caspase family protein [Saprospiraceae bacterium]|nr:caspase family protein [Saprospiraceae bacterium]